MLRQAVRAVAARNVCRAGYFRQYSTELDGSPQFQSAFARVQLPLSWTGTVKDVLEPMVPIIYEHNAHETVRKELNELADLLTKNPFSRDLLVDVYKKTQFQGVNVSPYTRLILAELGRRDQLKTIPKVAETLVDVFAQLNNEHHVEITLAAQPTPEQVEELRNELVQHLFKGDKSAKITVSIEVNPAIIAGRVYRFRDGLLNMSVSQFLESYKDERLAQKTEAEQQFLKREAQFRQPLNADKPTSNSKLQALLQQASEAAVISRGLAFPKE